jgi:hypothetical protein
MLTGGCQCGAVRFQIAGDLGRASLCHCRMCQKAFGSAFAPLVSVRIEDLLWTHGHRKRFQSSDTVWRGFCADCGTPLTFEWSKSVIDLAIGAFDDPAAVIPVVQLATESALPWATHIADLPGPTAEEAARMAAYYAGVRSRQHPDHD